jgi:hypothetical protein
MQAIRNRPCSLLLRNNPHVLTSIQRQMQQIQAFVPAVASAVSRSTSAPEQRSGVTLEDGASLLFIHYEYGEFWLHLIENTMFVRLHIN